MSGTLKSLKSLKNMVWDKKYPVSLIQFVTNRCNARCSFCFIDFNNKEQQSRANELKVADFDLLTRNLGPNLLHVNITGGEPFLRPDLVEICKCYFRNAGLSSILINSNGSLPAQIKKFLTELFHEFPSKRIYFVFSIDAFSEEHNRIRKIPGLFEKAMESYKIVKEFEPRATASINITVTHENYKIVTDIYQSLKNEYGITAFNPVLVRDEGVHKTPEPLKLAILDAYRKLSNAILEDFSRGELTGFGRKKLRDLIINAKNHIQYKEIANNYLSPEYKSLCPAGSIFGVVRADGTVYPCEILDKPIGNLRDYNFDFVKLWHDKLGLETKKWIKDTKCHCHWECAWTYNILSNPQYHFQLAKTAIHSYATSKKASGQVKGDLVWAEK